MYSDLEKDFLEIQRQISRIYLDIFLDKFTNIFTNIWTYFMNKEVDCLNTDPHSLVNKGIVHLFKQTHIITIVLG